MLFYTLSNQVDSLDLTQERNVLLIVRDICSIFFLIWEFSRSQVLNYEYD